MIYSYDGILLSECYDKDGLDADAAYDSLGNVIYQKVNAIRVMTYNVGQWYEGGGTNVPADKDFLYYELQNGMLTNNNPDVLCIEEYWKIFSKTGRTALSILQPLFPYIHEEGGDSGYFGRCICSKYPITNYTNHFYTNDAQRYYDSCIIDVNGVEFTLVITHLGLTIEDRSSQIQELKTYLDTLSMFIACGDYNTPYNSDSASLSELNPLRNEGYNFANGGNLGYFATAPGGTKSNWIGWIDNIITSENINIIGAQVDKTKEQLDIEGVINKIDHEPFMALVSLPITQSDS